MTKERKLIIRFMAVFFIVYLGFTLPYTLAIPFMIEAGYTPTERGLILAGMSLVGIFGQFIFGYLCDRFLTVKKFFFGSMIALVFTSWLAYATTENMLFYHLMTIAFTGGLFQIVMGLLDAWTLERDPYLVLHYGKIRAFGALGWAVGSPLTAYIVSRFGYDKLGVANLIITVLTLLVSWNMKDAIKVKPKENINWHDIGKLIKQKQYILLVIILFLLYTILAADMYTVIDKILLLGGTNSDVSMKWSFQAVMELPLFFLGGWLLIKFGGKKLLLFATAMYLIRFLGSAWATTPFMLIAVSGLQMVTFPLLNVASKVLIADESPLNLRSTGLLFATSLSFSLASLISPLLFGFLVEKFGINETLYGLAVACIIPFLLILWYMTMKPLNKEVIAVKS